LPGSRAGPGGILLLAVLSSIWGPASRTRLSGIEGFLVRLQAKIRARQFAGLFLLVVGMLSYESYEVRELLFGWLLFALSFLSIVLFILGLVLACHAGKYVIHWAHAAFRAANSQARVHIHVHAAKVFALLVRSSRRVFSS
jgi:hypothetical protein